MRPATLMPVNNQATLRTRVARKRKMKVTPMNFKKAGTFKMPGLVEKYKQDNTFSAAQDKWTQQADGRSRRLGSYGGDVVGQDINKANWKW